MWYFMYLIFGFVFVWMGVYVINVLKMFIGENEKYFYLFIY